MVWKERGPMKESQVGRVVRNEGVGRCGQQPVVWIFGNSHWATMGPTLELGGCLGVGTEKWLWIRCYSTRPGETSLAVFWAYSRIQIRYSTD